MSINQFALYRVKQDEPLGRRIWRQPYREVRVLGCPITVESYRQIHMGKIVENEKAPALRKRLADRIEISDVLVMNREGILSYYYMDQADAVVVLTGFIRMNSSGSLISVDTENYRIRNHAGSWMTTDDIIIDGKQFFLLEHQHYREQAAYVILDEYGKIVADECLQGFDNPEIIQKIRNFMDAEKKQEQQVEQTQQKSRLEIWQKYFQNGEYLRSAESGTEANYDMVDGIVNNQPLKETEAEVTGASIQKKKERQMVRKPKSNRKNPNRKRPSVMKRLRAKQRMIAEKSGRPIPAYLKENERDRK